MNNSNPERKNERVCACSGTTARQIQRLIDKGVADYEGISSATGAGSGCGACDPEIRALLAEYRAGKTLAPPI